MVSRLSHNKAVQDNTTIANIDWNGYGKTVDIATGHLDDVSAADAREFAEEHDDEIKAAVDDMAIHERGGDGIGYATVEDGELVDWTIYGQYTR